MTGTDLIESDLKSILATAEDGNYVAAYENVVAALDKQAREVRTIGSREGRKNAWKTALATSSRKDVAVANKALKGLMTLVKRNADIAASEGPRMLTEAEATSLMEQQISVETIEELVAALREEVKRLTFAHMTEQFAGEGEEFPDQVNASIEVPAFGKRFAREGGGRKDPSLDEDKLAKLLGEKVWASVTTETIIPAQTVRKVNYEALMREARYNPAILEHLRSALKVGEFKKPRLVVRDL